MARTKEQVKQSMLDNVALTDPTIDVSQGPLHDASIEPSSSEIAIAEQSADELVNFYSADAEKTDEQIEIFNTNFTITAGDGEAADGFVFFIMFSQPVADITIFEGTLVSTEDRSLIYKTSKEVIVVAATISSFFNASTSQYEIRVPVEAINVGPEFDISPFRVNTLLDPISGIDKVENRAKIEGGLDAESSEERFDRIQNRFAGTDLGTQNGVITKVEDFSPTIIKAVSLVRGGERFLFKRTIDSLALDVYILGEDSVEELDEEQTLTTTTDTVVLLKQPVISVASVFVNDVSTSFQLQKDTGILSDSTESVDSVVFSSNLSPGDLVRVTYNYNAIIGDVKENVFGDGEDALFDVDILVRAMIQRKVVVQGKLTVSPSKNIDTAIAEVETKLQELISLEESGPTFFPEIVRQQVISDVAGVTNFKLEKFTTTTKSFADLETVELEKNEFSELDLDLLNIT